MNSMTERDLLCGFKGDCYVRSAVRIVAKGYFSPHQLNGCIMLVLSRKEGERIVIGDNIVVTLLRVKGNSIRIGIDADREVPIRRHDLRASSSLYELAGTAPAVSTTA